jgi:hypothetical protein
MFAAVLVRLDTAITHRAEVAAKQDALVATAQAEVAAAILDLDKTEIRLITSEAR